MKKISHILVISCLMLAYCSSSNQMLPNPTGEGNLLIGSILLDIDGYQDKYSAVWDRIEVAIVGRYVENGMLKDFGEWISSDENGYFVKANMPGGEYAIKGFRVRLFGDESLTFWDPEYVNHEQQFELTDYNGVILHGSRFDVKSDGHIINFKHNIFKLMRSGLVDFQRKDRIYQYRLATGEELNNPPVPVYFLEAYPNNPWSGYLNLSLN